MKILPLILFASTVGLASMAMAQTAMPMPGYYQYKSTTMGAGKKAGRTGPVFRCITARDMDDPERIFNITARHAHADDMGCVIQHLQREPQHVSYDIKCRDRHVHVDGRFSENNIDAVRSVRAKSSTTSSNVMNVIAVAGKRMGDCKK